MAKKSWGTSDKVQEARDRKNSSKKEAAEAEAKQKEEAYWSQHANPKGRKDAKREEQVRGRVTQPACRLLGALCVAPSRGRCIGR